MIQETVTQETVTQETVIQDDPAEFNVHLPYHQRVQVHHQVVAALAHKYTPQGSVLDIGCGLGYTLRELGKLNPNLELSGADQDQVCLDRTLECNPGATTIRMGDEGFDVESLGTGYDACIMSHILEHLPRPLEAVQRLLPVLRPGGHLILAVPNPVCPVSILDSIRRKSRVNPGHLQTWDRPHWMNFLENRVGAEVVEYASDEVRILPSRWKQKIRLIESLHIGLAKVLPWWSFSNIAVIRR